MGGEGTLPRTSCARLLRTAGELEGWLAVVKTRNTGNSSGQNDVYFRAPSGRQFRSRNEVAKHLGLLGAAPGRGKGKAAGEAVAASPAAAAAAAPAAAPAQVRLAIAKACGVWWAGVCGCARRGLCAEKGGVMMRLLVLLWWWLLSAGVWGCVKLTADQTLCMVPGRWARSDASNGYSGEACSSAACLLGGCACR